MAKNQYNLFHGDSWQSFGLNASLPKNFEITILAARFRTFGRPELDFVAIVLPCLFAAHHLLTDRNPTPRSRATFFCVKPASSIPIALERTAIP